MSPQTTVTTLNKLIRACRDAQWLCTAWGRTAESANLRSRFHIRGEEWGRHGDELQALVLLLNGEPATSATLSAGLQSLWLECRYTVMGRSDTAAMEGCESIQQFALGCYEQALAGYLPGRIRRTVSMQAEQIAARCSRPLLHVAGREGSLTA